MADQATYIGIVERSLKAGATIARGLRLTKAAGVVTAAAIGVRGDFVALTDGENGKMFQGAPIQAGGKIPVVASEITAIDDPAYSAAAGKASKTAGGGAILLGKWTTVTAADALGEIEFTNPL